MSKIWKEVYDWKNHRNRMWGEGCEPEKTPDANLIPKWVYFVNVCSFTFEFHSVNQIETCYEFYSKKIRPSSCIPENDLWQYGGDHSETQRWFERLPQRLFKEPKRLKVLKALKQAIDEFKK